MPDEKTDPCESSRNHVKDASVLSWRRAKYTNPCKFYFIPLGGDILKNMKHVHPWYELSFKLYLGLYLNNSGLIPIIFLQLYSTDLTYTVWVVWMGLITMMISVCDWRSDKRRPADPMLVDVWLCVAPPS